MKNYNLILMLLMFLLLTKCGIDNDEIFGEEVRHQIWLTNDGADLAITVEGNTHSKRLCLMVHGGPGASSHEFNTFTKPFTDIIERDYAMVYYDQRAAGISKGIIDDETQTIAQHIDDLDKVIDMLYFRYGEDISIALMGHSWGGYLTGAYILDSNRASKVGAWVNIDGGIHRSNFINDDMRRIIEIADIEIANGQRISEWTDFKNQAIIQLDSNIVKYTYASQEAPFRILSGVEQLINQEGILENITGSTFDAIYLNNYQPFIASANDSRSSQQVQEEMFEFDATVEAQLPDVTLPTINLYGYWDVRTALQQGEYVYNTIATPEESKALVILEDSGHSPMVNEPDRLGNTIIDWLEIHL